ncbi:MAG: hypothetical protein PHI84_22105 [Kiritimatiellae bacterium]|nr:hypothetical protein [Kiritimatiellia bacterium]
MPEEIVPNGNDEVKTKWKEAGFESEDAAIESAKAATDLRSKITEAEAMLKKEREAKSKTDSDYLRQSNEIGELRKKLKDLEKPPDPPPAEDKNKNDEDEVLESLTEEERAVHLAVLNDPKNAELKESVIRGGKKAAAEFVKTYRAESPVDLDALFNSGKKKKSDTISTSSIAKKVKELFAQHNDEERNNLAAVPSGGAPSDPQAKAKRQMVTGGVGVDFFRKEQR